MPAAISAEVLGDGPLGAATPEPPAAEGTVGDPPLTDVAGGAGLTLARDGADADGTAGNAEVSSPTTVGWLTCPSQPHKPATSTPAATTRRAPTTTAR